MSSAEVEILQTAADKWRSTESTRWSARFLTSIHNPPPLESIHSVTNPRAQLYDGIATGCLDLGVSQRILVLIGFGIGLKLGKILKNR